MARTVTEFLEHWPDADALRWLVAGRLEIAGRRIASRSRETATHYKWLLAGDSDTRVWLHEFKPGRERRDGFASTVHNHRYPFHTVALAGSYVNERYQVSFERPSLSIVDHEVIRSDLFCEGFTYTMAPHEFHCVEDIEDGTQTLVIELAPVTASSFSVDQKGDRMIEHIPLEMRISRLLESRTQPTASSIS